jgi:hypothetical protein
LTYLIIYVVMVPISFVFMLTYLAINDPIMDDSDRIGSSAIMSLIWPLLIVVLPLIKLSDTIVYYITRHK